MAISTPFHITVILSPLLCLWYQSLFKSLQIYVYYSFLFYIIDRITRPFKSLHSFKSCSSSWHNWRWGSFAIESWTWHNLHFLKGDTYKSCAPVVISLLSSDDVCYCRETSSDWIMTLWNKKDAGRVNSTIKIVLKGDFLISWILLQHKWPWVFKNCVIPWCVQVSVSLE